MVNKNCIRLALFWVFIILCPDIQAQQSNQVKILERVSPTELLVEAKGVYFPDTRGLRADAKARKAVDDHGLDSAAVDAKRNTMRYLLYYTVDPILGDEQSRNAFESYRSAFFQTSSVNKYFTFEERKVRSSMVLDDGKGIEVVKRFKINTQLLKQDLADLGIIKLADELASNVGNPTIAVLPDVKEGVNPIRILQTDGTAKQAIAVIQSYLTARTYDVIVPEQIQEINEMVSAIDLVEGRQEDLSYKIALAIGSDIYIKTKTNFEAAEFGTQKAVTQITAFETTTGRLLGTETGYSRGRNGSRSVSIEESINDAIDKVLSRINAYWIEDLKDGLQYKTIISISSDFDSYESEDISFEILDLIEQASLSVRQNVFTSNTIDMNVWCDFQEYPQSLDLYRELRSNFSYAGARLTRSVINRKLIQLEVILQ